MSRVRAIVLSENVSFAEQMAKTLKQDGYEVVLFTNPREALLQIDHFKPHVFVSDTEMRNMSGLRVLEAIKDSYPELPVIFVSEDLKKEVLIPSVALGVFGVIESPYDESELKRFCYAAISGERAPNLAGSEARARLVDGENRSGFLARLS